MRERGGCNEGELKGELDNTDVKTMCVVFTHRHSKASIHTDVKIPRCHRNS